MCCSTVLWINVSGSNNKLISYILLPSLWDIRGCVSVFLLVCPLVCLPVFSLPVYPSIRLCIYRLEEFTVTQM
jgi:hypothetical protein